MTKSNYQKTPANSIFPFKSGKFFYTKIFGFFTLKILRFYTNFFTPIFLVFLPQYFLTPIFVYTKFFLIFSLSGRLAAKVEFLMEYIESIRKD